jgi:hypothetical protein
MLNFKNSTNCTIMNHPFQSSLGGVVVSSPASVAFSALVEEERDCPICLEKMVAPIPPPPAASSDIVVGGGGHDDASRRLDEHQSYRHLGTTSCGHLCWHGWYFPCVPQTSACARVAISVFLAAAFAINTLHPLRRFLWLLQSVFHQIIHHNHNH